jgi:hypothetical protein
LLGLFYHRRSAAKKRKNENSTPGADLAGQPELDSTEAGPKAVLAPTANVSEMGGELSEEEKLELERWRMAAELDGSSTPVPLGAISERAELEARKRGAREVFEMS